MADGKIDTVGNAMSKFELIIKKLLNCPLKGVAGTSIFDLKVIAELRQVAKEIEDQRCRKNWGVIGGSSAGIVGGGVAIAGAALIPFTFGTSIGLMITGTAIGVTSAGVILGFTLDKKFKDENKIPILQNALKKFIHFQKDLAIAMVTIRICEQAIGRIKKTGLVDVKLRPQEEMSLAVMHLYDQVHTLFRRETDDRNIGGRINDIMRYAKTMQDLLNKILDPIKLIFTAGESSWFEDQVKNAEQNPFDMLASCVQTNQINPPSRQVNQNFSSFVERYLRANNTTDETSSRLPVGIGLDAAGNLIARGGVTGGRVALKYVNTASNLAHAGGNVLKIAKAVSIAGIVLGAAGVVVDIGFLGHAIYDLQQKDAEELSQSFTDLANIMEEINNISMNY